MTGSYRRASVAVGIAVMAGSLLAREAPTVSDGVYTDAQATRGQAAYEKHCVRCHLADLGGDQLAAPLVGEGFLQRWQTSSLAVLFNAVRKTMPSDDPGSASDEEYAAIIAYVLKTNQFPAGTRELSSKPAELESIGFGKGDSGGGR
jgi:mono/diheme cytochrome c family protein